MRIITRLEPAFVLFLAMTVSALGQDAKLSVLAAENFYGDIAGQIGGDHSM